ncbi:MAG: nicotinamidase [Vicinamibacteria bacterium]|nr:nicotinamidase [Vicinamibacteria bacterium]
MAQTFMTEIPAHYNPQHSRQFGFRPDAQSLFEAAGLFRRENHLLPAASDLHRNHLVLIDVQRDFCFPEGTLFVGGHSGHGAMDDNDRIARFIYQNLGLISEITCTLDSHLPFQIFFAPFWVDRAGAPLAPHRTLSRDEIRAGDARPNPDIVAAVGALDLDWLTRQVLFYSESLEKAGKYVLYLWPPHVLLGGDGHALTGVIQEARLFHAYARGARNGVEIKGLHPLTENYSVFSPEVLLTHDGASLASRNGALIDSLLREDRLIIAGQASSHCVKSSVDDLLDAILEKDAQLARRVYIVEDAMSAVAVPDPAKPGTFLADFTDAAQNALGRYQEAGMHIVRTTTPVSDWPHFLA